MSEGEMHKIWLEQYEAADNIKLRYGLKAAFDYLVAEKVLNFADAAARHPAFAHELPKFVSRVRLMFTPQEMRAHITRLEYELFGNDVTRSDEDDFLTECPATVAKRASQFATIKELLTARELGTS